MANKHSKAHIKRMTRLLFAAIKANDGDGVRNALERGADPKATKYGFTPSDLAFRVPRRWDLCPTKTSIDVVTPLLEAGLFPSEIRLTAGDTSPITKEWFDLYHRFGIKKDDEVLWQLVMHGDIDLWDYCKERLSIDIKRVNGADTPLHLTLTNTQRTFWAGTVNALKAARVDRLLDAGFGIEERKNGDTPLIIAIKARDTSAVEVLLSRGADVSAKDGSDRTLSEVMDWNNSSPDMRATVDRYLLAKTTGPVLEAVTARRL